MPAAMNKGSLSVFDFGYNFDKNHDAADLYVMCSKYNIPTSSRLKPALLFELAGFFARYRVKHGRYDRSYLNKGFVPRDYTNSQMHQVLAYHNIRVPAKANFKTMHALFEDNLESMRDELSDYQRAAPLDLDLDMERLKLHPNTKASPLTTLPAPAQPVQHAPSAPAAVRALFALPDEQTRHDAQLLIGKLYSHGKALTRSMDDGEPEDVVEGLRTMLYYMPHSIVGEYRGKPCKAAQGCGIEEHEKEYSDTASELLLQVGGSYELAARVVGSDPGHAVDILKGLAASLIRGLVKLD